MESQTGFKSRPIREFYRKDGKLYERWFVVTYEPIAGANEYRGEASISRRRHILSEREAESFPDIGSAPRSVSLPDL